MKTLSDLKREAHKFQWSLIKNSWFDGIPEHQKGFRDVATVQSTKFSLWTNHKGEKTESWVDFPKAKELTIHEVRCHGIIMGYEVTFQRDTGAVNKHEMIYFLREATQ